ncbi:MAG: hypothetical protein CVU57_30620 [Deltaproteobacteria bacterium HGW-Deltaproteobacteria-15]|jgi:hypothetical protein|nr:MAG: hypothetical protein CVU57_30620 [Deltaproteobacteria bacterium HGW-Deltaproteobacteria-15]
MPIAIPAFPRPGLRVDPVKSLDGVEFLEEDGCNIFRRGFLRFPVIASPAVIIMNADELFSRMEERFGKYPDCGVVCSNGNEIRSIGCEIDWYMLYHVMTDSHTLYVVHHPVSDFALRLPEINPDEKEDDIRSEAQNWLLEFRARELGMNLAVAHTVADKMLETELSDWLEGARGEEIVTRIDAFFDRFFKPHPEIVVLPEARPLLEQNGRAEVVLGTYGYRVKKGVVYVDECGMEETNQAITIPHSLVDVSAMKLWKAAAVELV